MFIPTISIQYGKKIKTDSVLMKKSSYGNM